MHKDYFDLAKSEHLRLHKEAGMKVPFNDYDFESKQNDKVFEDTGPERHFEPRATEVFDPNEFTLIFFDADSVTNVTSLNRVNHRRILIFVGNGNGLISFGKGKGEDYEAAFDNAFKKMRANMVCLQLDSGHTWPRIISARHNDFRITIWP